MDTKNFNFENNGKKSNKNMSAGQTAAAAGVAGAAMGAAATAAGMYFSQDHPDDPVTPVNNNDDHVEQDQQGQTTAQTDQPAEAEIVAEVTAEEVPVDDPSMHGATEVVAEVVNEDLASSDAPEAELIAEVDPNEIADDIIAIEEIDPNDIDSPDAIAFEEVGVIYDETGAEYNAAIFQDDSGNEMMMVDVDGDMSFDIVIDENGNLVGEVNDLLTVADAESMIQDDNSYLASDDSVMDDIDATDFSGDMMS